MINATPVRPLSPTSDGLATADHTDVIAKATKAPPTGTTTTTTVSSGSPLTPKKKFPLKWVLGGLFFLLLVVGAGVGLYLTQQGQDLRQQAKEELGAGNVYPSPTSTSGGSGGTGGATGDNIVVLPGNCGNNGQPTCPAEVGTACKGATVENNGKCVSKSTAPDKVDQSGGKCPYGYEGFYDGSSLRCKLSGTGTTTTGGTSTSCGQTGQPTCTPTSTTSPCSGTNVDVNGTCTALSSAPNSVNLKSDGTCPYGYTRGSDIGTCTKTSSTSTSGQSTSCGQRGQAACKPNSVTAPCQGSDVEVNGTCTSVTSAPNSVNLKSDGTCPYGYTRGSSIGTCTKTATNTVTDTDVAINGTSTTCGSDGYVYSYDVLTGSTHKTNTRCATANGTSTVCGDDGYIYQYNGVTTSKTSTRCTKTPGSSTTCGADGFYHTYDALTKKTTTSTIKCGAAAASCASGQSHCAAGGNACMTASACSALSQGSTGSTAQCTGNNCNVPSGGCIAIHGCSNLDSEGHCTVATPDVVTHSVDAQAEANRRCQCVQVDVLDGRNGSCSNGHINGDQSTLKDHRQVCPNSSANCAVVTPPATPNPSNPPDNHTDNPNYSCNSSCSTDAQCKTDNSKFVCATTSNGKRCRLGTNTTATNCQALTGPACLSISISKVDGTTISVGNNDPKMGDTIKFTCGAVPNVDHYVFRVTEPDGNKITLSATGAVSDTYTITKSGHFNAQCQVCSGTDANSCNAFENLN